MYYSDFLIVLDSMIVIHLAKTGLLAETKELHGRVVIPAKVLSEVFEVPKREGVPDAFIVEQAVNQGVLEVETVKTRDVKAMERLGLFGGEAECVVLAQKHRCLLGSDDKNVRNKAPLLEVKLVGTPSIVVSLVQKKIIDRSRALEAIAHLRKKAWFHPAVLDKVREVIEHA